MMFQEVCHQYDSACSRNIWETDQTMMCNILRENELSEIRIDGNEDSFFPEGEVEERKISGVRPQR